MVRGLVPRWAAQRPQYSQRALSVKTLRQVLGLLRSPARGKPAHHRNEFPYR
jgi:hypothetical protein